MAFTFSGVCRDDGSWSLDVVVDDGQTVLKGDVVDRVLVPAAYQLTVDRLARIPTVSEMAALVAARTLPGGWEPTNDGINTELVLGEGQRYSRTYKRMDGGWLIAPCAQDGSALPATRTALLEFDANTPHAEA